MDDETRDKVRAKIQALLSKTTQSGATEAEAIAAASKARELMDKYQISLDGVGLRSDGFSEAQLDMFSYQDPRARLVSALAEYADTRLYHRREAYQRRRLWIIFGLKPDVELGHYTWKMITQLEEKFWETDKRHIGSAAKSAWQHGFYNRMGEKLREIKLKRKMEDLLRKKTGTSLIILKDQIVDEEMAHRYKLDQDTTSDRPGSVRDTLAYLRGRQRAEEAEITEAIKQQAQ